MGRRIGTHKPPLKLRAGAAIFQEFVVPAIIKHNRFVPRLPDLRNLGVILRIVLAVNLLGFAAAVIESDDWRALAANLLDVAAVLEPLLMAELLALFVLCPWLSRLRYRLGIAV